MKTFVILNVLLIFINIELILTWKCGSDKLNISPKPLNSSMHKTKKNNALRASSYTPIKIGYDFTSLKRPSSMSSSVFTNVKSLLQETRKEFSKILQIKHTNIDLSNYLGDIIDVCEVYSIGADYKNFLIDNDLIIFPMFDSLDEGVLAAAAPCIIDEYSRPIAGVLFINNKLNFEITNANYYMKNLLLHEITHILAFHPFFFETLGMSKIYGSASYITSSKAVAKAREHFGCSSLTQIPLENQGGSGSVGAHWESRYMLGDYMISTDYPDQAISDITLGLFEDTGFYKVNYYSGGLFKFGKGKGCDFFNKKCIENQKATFEEFCVTKSEAKCSSTRAIKSSCYIETYVSNLPSEYQYFNDPKRGGFFAADYCPVPLIVNYENDYFPNHCQLGKSQLSSEYGETIGKNSLCVMSSLLPGSSSTTQSSQIPICYSVDCGTSTNNVIIKIGSDAVTCPTEGGIVTNPPGYKGSIICPKYSEICSSNDGLICNEMFSCFTELANKNNYNYRTNYYDYEGSSIDLSDDYIDTITLNGSFIAKFNLALLVILGLFLFFN